MIEAIILAGGRSRRSAPRHKACRRLPGERRSWLDRQIDSLRDAGVGHIVLVLGHRPRRVLACLHRRAGIVRNPRPGIGPFASLQYGLHSCRSGRILIVPVDTPVPGAMALKRLSRLMPSADAAIPTDRQRRGGHPVAISQRFAHHLRRLDPRAPAARLNSQLRALPSTHSRRIPLAGFDVRQDLNTEQAWLLYRKRRQAAATR